MILETIIERKRPFFVMLVSSGMGNDWFAVMHVKDCKGLKGVRCSGTCEGLKEADLDSDDVAELRRNRMNFKRVSVSHNVAVYEPVCVDFREYLKKLKAN